MAKRKCSKGYNCGKTCISRKINCKSNLSVSGEKLLENYAQFLARKQEIDDSELVAKLKKSFENSYDAFSLDGSIITTRKISNRGGRLSQQFLDSKPVAINLALGRPLFQPANIISISSVPTPEFLKSAAEAGADYVLQVKLALDNDYQIFDAKTGKQYSGRDAEDKLDIGFRSDSARQLKKDGVRALNNPELADLPTDENEIWGRPALPMAPVDIIQKEAITWAKSQGFDADSGANGFSARQTRAHDMMHPIAHKLTGLDSAGLKKHFDLPGESIIGEEAIVNFLEHMYAGDSFYGSALNAIRLARVLSRNEKPEIGNAIRNDKFRDKLLELIEVSLKNEQFSAMTEAALYSIRNSNTVITSGEDFTNSATGG